jgi:hypothetical protein
MNWVVLTRVLCVLGVLLHVYQFSLASTTASSWMLVGLLFLSCPPYAIAWALTTSKSWQLSGLGIALACLLADCLMHYAVFIAPKSSTAALGLVAMPLWNLLVTAPVGAGLGWLIARWLRQKH